jgi:hypothetical protein
MALFALDSASTDLCLLREILSILDYHQQRCEGGFADYSTSQRESLSAHSVNNVARDSSNVHNSSREFGSPTPAGDVTVFDTLSLLPFGEVPSCVGCQPVDYPEFCRRGGRIKILRRIWRWLVSERRVPVDAVVKVS